MNSILKCSDLSIDEFLTLLENASFPREEPVRLWLEGHDGWSLSWWPGLSETVSWCGSGREPTDRPLKELLPASVSGRIFAPSGELRWRNIPALGARRCRTVFLGEVDFFPDRLQDRSGELSNLVASKGEVILWGQKTHKSGKDWIELRIPNRFRYPVHDREIPAGGRIGVKSIVEQWKDTRGEPHFIRLCDLVAYQEK